MITIPDGLFVYSALAFIAIVAVIAPLVLIWWCFYQPENGD